MTRPARFLDSDPLVGEGAARTLLAPLGGMQDMATTTTVARLLIPTTWFGRYVEVEVAGADHYVVAGTATSGIVTTTQTSVNSEVPIVIVAGVPRQFVWPSDGSRTHLVYRTVSGTGQIRIRLA